MTKHLLSHDYRWFVRKSFRSEIMALRRVDQKRRNRVLSRLILDPNSRGLRQAGLLRLAAVVSDMGAVAALSSCTWRASPVLAVLPTGAGSNRGKITVKVVFACTCTWSS